MAQEYGAVRQQVRDLESRHCDKDQEPLPWCLEEPRRRGALKSRTTVVPWRSLRFVAWCLVMEEISSRDEKEIKKPGAWFRFFGRPTRPLRLSHTRNGF
jgi:hypothetical protein